MVYKVRVTDKAKTDLDEIIRYIAEKLANVTLCNDIKLQKKGYHRFLFYKNYLALYSIDDKEKIVYILHIFYAKRDYAKSV